MRAFPTGETFRKGVFFFRGGNSKVEGRFFGRSPRSMCSSRIGVILLFFCSLIFVVLLPPGFLPTAPRSTRIRVGGCLRSRRCERDEPVLRASVVTQRFREKFGGFPRYLSGRRPRDESSVSGILVGLGARQAQRQEVRFAYGVERVI